MVFARMPDHYHFLVETPRGNLSQATSWLQAAYTIRFKAHLIERDAYAPTLLRYVHLNPVRARDTKAVIDPGRCPALDAFHWSSHRAYAGLEEPAGWLSLEWLLRHPASGSAQRVPGATSKRLNHRVATDAALAKRIEQLCKRADSSFKR